MKTRRRFTAEFKTKIALEAIRGERTVSEPAAKHQLHLAAKPAAASVPGSTIQPETPALDLRREDTEEVYATAQMTEQ